MNQQNRRDSQKGPESGDVGESEGHLVSKLHCDCSGGDGFYLYSSFEGTVCRDSCDGDLKFQTGGFPHLEMPAISSEIASQEVAIHPVIVVVRGFHVDEFVVSFPTGIGFTFCVGTEDEAAPFSLSEFTQEMFGVFRE